MLHMSRVSTRPGKAGVAIGSMTPEPTPPLGIMPRTARPLAAGKARARFSAHRDPAAERKLMMLLRKAIEAGEINETELADAVARKFIRSDIWQCM
jgi:hypothetical protein